MPLTHNQPMITPHHVWREKHRQNQDEASKTKFLELQRISSQNKELLISVLQMFISYKRNFSYLDIWAFFKSLETQSFSLNKCSIENRILNRENPIDTQMSLNMGDQGEFQYRNLLSIDEFWNLLLDIAQELHFKQLSLEAKSDYFPTLFRYLIEEIVLKIDDFCFNEPFRKLQLKYDSKLLIQGSYHFLVPLFNAYANNKKQMAQDNFLKLLFDAQIFQDGYTKVQANKVLNEVLAKSPGQTGRETQRDDAVSVRDIAQFSQYNGRQLIFYDFLECLFGLAQYGDKETSKKPLKKFVKFIDSTLLPKIKLYIDFFSESEKDQDNQRERLDQLKSFKIPLKPMEELWNRYMGKNKFINH